MHSYGHKADGTVHPKAGLAFCGRSGGDSTMHGALAEEPRKGSRAAPTHIKILASSDSSSSISTVCSLSDDDGAVQCFGKQLCAANPSGGAAGCALLQPGIRTFTDPPPRSLLARAAWEALGIAALIGYLIVPFLMLGILLLAVCTMHPVAVTAAAALGATLLLPAGPLMFSPFLEGPLLKALRLYFQFSVTVTDPAALGRPAIWAEYPHSVFPLSQLLAVSLDPARWPGLRVPSVGASVLFAVPLWRHMLSWLGMRSASRADFEGLLLERGAVKVQPGGIAEMYLTAADAEVIKALDRRGFVRLAVEHGVPLIPTYHFGNSQLLQYGPKSLEALSRRLRVSLGFAVGRWGLPLLPERVPLHMVVGSPVPVRRLPRDHPEFESAVALAHAAYLAALQDLYYAHCGQYGWSGRPLILT